MEKIHPKPPHTILSPHNKQHLLKSPKHSDFTGIADLNMIRVLSPKNATRKELVKVPRINLASLNKNKNMFPNITLKK